MLSLVQGRKIFRRWCKGCHGTDLECRCILPSTRSGSSRSQTRGKACCCNMGLLILSVVLLNMYPMLHSWGLQCYYFLFGRFSLIFLYLPALCQLNENVHLSVSFHIACIPYLLSQWCLTSHFTMPFMFWKELPFSSFITTFWKLIELWKH